MTALARSHQLFHALALQVTHGEVEVYAFLVPRARPITHRSFGPKRAILVLGPYLGLLVGGHKPMGLFVPEGGQHFVDLLQVLVVQRQQRVAVGDGILINDELSGEDVGSEPDCPGRRSSCAAVGCSAAPS